MLYAEHYEKVHLSVQLEMIVSISFDATMTKIFNYERNFWVA